MTGTSVWIPISSAAAALLGGGFGAMLQGRYGVSGWRRQIRLEAYTGFVNVSHDFNKYLYEAFDSVGEPDFDKKWSKVREAESAMGRAGSLVSIAGPLSVDIAAREVMSNTRLIVKDRKDSDLLSAIARDIKEGRRYNKNRTWIESAYSFADAGRKVLRTHGSGRRFRGQA